MSMDVQASGPIFDGTAPDIVAAHLGAAVEQLEADAESTWRAQLVPGHGYETGQYASSINGQMVDSMHGAVQEGDGVVGAWLEAGSSNTDRTRFRGYHIFRETLYEVAQEAAGLAEDAGAAAAEELNA